MERCISFFLLLTMFLLPLASCGGGETAEMAATAAVPIQETEPPETEDRSYKDDLPDDLDFKGAKIGVVSSINTFFNGEMIVASLDDVQTILDQARYDRKAFVEDRLNISLSEFADKSDNCQKLIGQCVQAGDDLYDISHMADRVIFQMGLDGNLTELNTLPNIDLTKSYWDQEGNKVFNFFDKQYVAFGELSFGTYDYCHALAFNQDLLNDYKMTSPYDYVAEDKWTFDKFSEMIAAAVKDLDGNGTMDDKDQYGFHTRNAFMYPLMYTAAGFKTVKIDDKGEPKFDMKGNQNFEDMYAWCTKAFLDSKAWYVHSAGNDFLVKQPLFQNGQVLFSDMTFFTIGQVREMESDFGIVPYPKYTEDQDRYYGWVEGGAKGIGAIMTTASKNPEATGAALEALCCYSYDGVIPVYYEINLKMKYSRDEIATQMFDLIRDSRTYDLGDTIWCSIIRDVFNQTFYNQRPLASEIASREEAINQKIADAVAKLKNG